MYTIITNKEKFGRAGCLLAIVAGTKAETVIAAVTKIPLKQRITVKSITRDLAESMSLISTACFPNARQIDDRFHVQKIVSEALQETRVELRKKAIKEHNQKVTEARNRGEHYWAPRYANGDTPKELLARGRYLLYKSSGRWSESQKNRAEILFREYPLLKSAYRLTMHFRGIYEHAISKEDAIRRLQQWYLLVEKQIATFPHFETPMQTIRTHENTIVNYFLRRETNASAESFNAKVKNFRTVQRGVRDIRFFLYRLVKLYG